MCSDVIDANGRGELMHLGKWLVGVAALGGLVRAASACDSGGSDASIAPVCGFFGCPDAGAGSDGGTASLVAVTFRGTVTSAGAPISGATVALTGNIATTDASGNFTLSATVASSGMGILDVSTTGMAPQVVSVPLKAGVTTYTIPVHLTPLQAQPLNANATTTVQVQVPGPADVMHPATVTIPAGAPAGTQVRVAPVSIADAPGTMRAEGGPAGDALASLGMFYIDYVDANGNAVPAPAGVTVAMGPQTPPTVPNADPFNGWMLNANGNWANPTPMTPPAAATPAPAAPIPQIGYWNSDHAFRTACIKGTLTAPSGACGGGRVDLTGPDGIHSVDTSGADGSFCLVGPQGHSGTLALSSTPSVNFPSQPGNCAAPQTCTDVSSFNISADQCQGAGGQTDGGFADGGTQACNAVVNSGGEAPESISVDLGKSSGSFDFEWNMYDVPDGMAIMYEGKTLFDTGCVSEDGSKLISFSGTSTTIMVNVNSDCTNQGSTSWDFTVNCP